MKYIIFLLALVINTVVVAQSSFEIYDPATGGLVNGGIVTVEGADTDDEIVYNLSVKNASASNISVKVKRYNINVVDGSMNALCWGTCFSPTVNVSPTPITIASGATNLSDFASHFSPNMTGGTSDVMFTFYNTANTSDSVSVTLRFIVTVTLIHSISSGSELISAATPNPANTFTYISYIMNGNIGKSYISVHNILGAEVKRIETNTKSGVIKLYTADLNPGAYFYSFVTDGKVRKTNKFIVKH